MAPTRAENDTPHFTYLPLADTDTNAHCAPHIRLIEVHNTRDSTNRPLCVSILRTSVADAPPYRAISYTWGDEADQEHITVSHSHKYFTDAHGAHMAQDGILRVRKNCADVLRQLAHFGFSTYYWLDAICIDQSNVPEKNVQVARMGEVFRCAEGVLACIGMHYDHSRFLASKLEEFDQYLADRGTSTLSETDLRYNPQDHVGPFSLDIRFENGTQPDRIQQVTACTEACIDWVSSISGEDSRLFLDALEDLTQRPYFWRIWTLQELWAARHIQLLCGYHKLSLRNLLFWWGGSRTYTPYNGTIGGLYFDIWQRKRADRNCNENFDHYMSRSVYGPGSAYEAILYNRHRISAEEPGSGFEKLSVFQLMNMCEDRECQDRRDTVYGTLTMVDWTNPSRQMPDGTWSTDEGNGINIVPDYARSRFELAKSLVPRFEWISVMKELCSMLKLSPEDKEIAAGLAYRAQLTQEAANWPSDTEPWTKSKSPQVLAKIRGRASRLSQHYDLEPGTISDSAATYTRILRRGVLVGIASTGVRPDDWQLRDGSLGLVLRKTGHYFSIVGKANIRDWQRTKSDGVTELNVWLGVDDLVVYLGTTSKFPPRKQKEPDASCIAELNTRFCAEPGSSFGTAV